MIRILEIFFKTLRVVLQITTFFALVVIASTLLGGIAGGVTAVFLLWVFNIENK